MKLSTQTNSMLLYKMKKALFDIVKIYLFAHTIFPDVIVAVLPIIYLISKIQKNSF